MFYPGKKASESGDKIDYMEVLVMLTARKKLRVMDKNEGIVNSYAISRSKNIIGSNAVSLSEGISLSESISLSAGIGLSEGIQWSVGIYASVGIADSVGLLHCIAMYNSAFCVGDTGLNKVFGVELSEDQARSIMHRIRDLLGDWLPAFAEYIDMDYDHERSMIAKAWKNMPVEAIEYIRSLETFNPQMFYEITGIE